MRSLLRSPDPADRPRRRRWFSLVALLVTLAACCSSPAQLVIMLPGEFSPPAPAAPRPAAVKPAPRPRTDQEKAHTVAAPKPSPVLYSPAAAIVLSVEDPPLTLLLSDFTAGSSTGGSERSGTSWTGNITQNAGSISVGGSARDENGWGATQLSLDASGMNTLVLIAQRDFGNATPVLFVQFEDFRLRTHVVSINTSLFATGTLTTVAVPLTGWTLDFGPSQITGWSIGGGGLGTTDFRMTFDSLSFSASAIPEPATYATLAGLLALGVAFTRQRRRRGKDIR